MDEPAPVANSSTPLTTLVESGMQSSKTSVVNLDRDLEKAKPEDNSRFTLKGIMVMVACTSAWIISNSNAVTMAILLPAMGRDLNIPQANLQWVTSAYSLSSGCLLILFGRMADVYGRKTVFLVGYIWLAIFSLACGFAQNEVTIDVLRALQGLGGGAVVPAALGILAETFPPGRQRAIAFSVFSAGSPLGGVLGFVSGAFLVQFTGPSWRSEFYLSAATSMSGIIIGILYIDRDAHSERNDKRLDWLGAFVITAGLVLVVFAMNSSSTAPNGWRTPYVIVILLLGVGLVVLFGVWQHYLETSPQNSVHPGIRWWTTPPLIKLSMFKRANCRFAVVQLIAVVNWCSFSCWFYWIFLYYQKFVGLSPVSTMVRIIPHCGVGIICNVIVAFWIGRVNAFLFLASGTLLTGVSNLFFAVINPSSSYWAFGFPSSLLIVFGADFVFAAGTLFIAKVSLPQEQSVAGALFQTMTQFGVAFGLSISTVVFSTVLKMESKRSGVIPSADGTNAPMNAQLKAYQAAEWTAFAFGVVGTLLCLLLRDIGIVGRTESESQGDEGTGSLSGQTGPDRLP